MPSRYFFSALEARDASGPLCAMATLSATLLLGSCASIPITTETIQGRYALPANREYLTGNSIELRDGKFKEDYFDDYAGDPALKDYPKRGRYKLKGCLLSLYYPDNTRTDYIITQRNGRLMMWTPEDYEKFLRTDKTSAWVLYQEPKNKK